MSATKSLATTAEARYKAKLTKIGLIDNRIIEVRPALRALSFEANWFCSASCRLLVCKQHPDIGCLQCYRLAGIARNKILEPLLWKLACSGKEKSLGMLARCFALNQQVCRAWSYSYHCFKLIKAACQRFGWVTSLERPLCREPCFLHGQTLCLRLLAVFTLPRLVSGVGCFLKSERSDAIAGCRANFFRFRFDSPPGEVLVGVLKFLLC